MIEYKNLASDIKADETGVLSGFASTSQLDSDNDRVFASAFRKTLDRANGEFNLCWQHHIDIVIGDVKLSLGRDRIPLDGKLNFEILKGIACMPKAFEAYALMKQSEKMSGNKKPGFSIGFKTLKSKQNKEGGRDITEIDLFEVSIVTIPANPGALGTVKQMGNYEELYEGFYNWMLEKGHFGDRINEFFKNTGTESHEEMIRRILSGG